MSGVAVPVLLGIAGSGAIAPAWLVFPAAAAGLLAVASHVRRLERADVPESRRRIRLVNAWVMMLLVAMLAVSFGAVSPSDPKAFVVAWTLTGGLLFTAVLLAVIDAGNTVRLHRRDQMELRRQMRDLRKVPQGSAPRGAAAKDPGGDER